ncbi:hypothetical protein CEE39_06545 [bacterium (candidate division B38) B3_B38]|nr:MAG: hypothetical protein CEE39_06545 [bacterium (candidate division B38) B3_B38]
MTFIFCDLLFEFWLNSGDIFAIIILKERQNEMPVFDEKRINLTKSSADAIVIPCAHFHYKEQLFGEKKNEKHTHEVTLAKEGCQHDCTSQGRKGRFACQVAHKGKALDRYFDQWKRKKALNSAISKM